MSSTGESVDWRSIAEKYLTQLDTSCRNRRSGSVDSVYTIALSRFLLSDHDSEQTACAGTRT